MKINILNKIKEQYPTIKLDEVETFQDKYKERFYYSVESKIEGRDFARNSLMFLVGTLQRSYSLFKGAINSLNNSDVISSYLASRAHMESTGSIAYFLIKLRKYYEKDISMEEIEYCLMQLYLGKKYYAENEDNPLEIQPINVLTLIDAVDKVFFKSTTNKGHRRIFRDTYEWISEFCHPNHFGQILGVKKDGRKAIFDYHHFPGIHEVQHFYFSLNSSCHLMIPMYDECLSLIEQHERLPELVKYKNDS